MPAPAKATLRQAQAKAAVQNALADLWRASSSSLFVRHHNRSTLGLDRSQACETGTGHPPQETPAYKAKGL
jgi:hypothetical protein